MRSIFMPAPLSRSWPAMMTGSGMLINAIVALPQSRQSRLAAIKWSDGHCFPASRLGSAQASSLPNGRALPRNRYKQPRGKAS